MGCTVSELLGRITSEELTEWIAFYEIEPFGDVRADLRSGMIASVMANLERDPKRKPDPFKATDFTPYLEKPKANVEQKIREIFK